MQDFREHTINEMRSLSTDLFPLARSIAGPALRESIGILGREMNFKILEFPSGGSAFDWVTPREWELRSATLSKLDGHVLIDASDNNLSVLNYSVPVEKKITGKELREHLFYSSERPEAIPYRTSYYEDNWGFCCTKSVYDSILDDEEYVVAIDASHAEGSLSVGETVIEGESDKEIVFTSYLCHPSMGVNELSGPLTLFALHRLLIKRKSRRFSYRFIISSETIGAIVYLSQNLANRQRNMIGGITFQMTGLNTPIIHRDCRQSSPLDTAIEAVAPAVLEESPKSYSRQDWSPIGGGDQRQWCAQGVNLPMSFLARNLGGSYPEYHTSDDDLSLLELDAAYQVAALAAESCLALELASIPEYIGPPCEPRLSKYGLQSSLGGPKASSGLDMLKVALGVADGNLSSLDIARKYGFNPSEFHSVLESAKKKGLISARPIQ